MIIYLIKLWQKFVSPRNKGIIRCKYKPSCSQYTIDAIKKYGNIKGCTKGFLRILRCNPLSKGGYDPA